MAFAGLDGATVFSVTFGWSRMVIFFKFSCLSGLSFSGPLASERRLSVGALSFLFFCLHTWAFLGCRSKSGMYETKRTPREVATASPIGPEIQGQFAFPRPSVSSYCCLTDNVQGS